MVHGVDVVVVVFVTVLVTVVVLVTVTTVDPFSSVVVAELSTYELVKTGSLVDTVTVCEVPDVVSVSNTQESLVSV